MTYKQALSDLGLQESDIAAALGYTDRVSYRTSTAYAQHRACIAELATQAAGPLPPFASLDWLPQSAFKAAHIRGYLGLYRRFVRLYASHTTHKRG